jgi:hypothetical protein
MITNAATTHAQRRRFVPDTGFEGTVGDAPEGAGCGVESDIFSSMGFLFASHKNIGTRFAIHHVMLSDFETTSIGFTFACRRRCGIPRCSRLLAAAEVFPPFARASGCPWVSPAERQRRHRAQ